MPDEIEDGSVEVKLPDDAVVVAAAEAPLSTDTELTKLKDQLRAAEERQEIERRAHETTTRRLASTEQQVTRFQSEAQQSQYDAVMRSLDAHQAHADMLEGHLRAAFEAGDYAGAAKLQRTMGTVSARMAQLEDGKVAMEAQRRAPPQPQQPSDPIEAALARYTPKTQQFLRAHPEILTDPTQGTLAAAADVKARRAGHVADTAEYFAFVEQELGYKERDETAEQRQPTRAAPPSRGNPATQRTTAPTGQSLTPDQVSQANDLGISFQGGNLRLSAKARSNAEVCGMTDAEYAKSALETIARGDMERRVH